MIYSYDKVYLRIAQRVLGEMLNYAYMISGLMILNSPPVIGFLFHVLISVSGIPIPQHLFRIPLGRRDVFFRYKFKMLKCLFRFKAVLLSKASQLHSFP